MSDKLIYIVEYFDGPISGFTNVDSKNYFFVMPFNKKIDEYENHCVLYPLCTLDFNVSLMVDEKSIVPAHSVASRIMSRLLEGNVTKQFAVPNFERSKPGTTAESFTVSWKWKD
jgi:hypothetical protein